MSRREDEVVNRRVVPRSTPAHVPRPDNFEIVPTGGAGAGRGEILVRSAGVSGWGGPLYGGRADAGRDAREHEVVGRIVAGGMMAGYTQQDEPPPVRHLWEVVARQPRM
jgi:hypothetical protein